MLSQLLLLLSGLVLCCLVAPLAAQSCTSCGPECVPACGSRRYRTCCFNYLRRRRSSSAPGAPASELSAIQDRAQDRAQDTGPDDVRLQLVLIPEDHLDLGGQDQLSALSSPGVQGLLHRLLEGPADGAATSTPAVPTPSPSAQRYQAGGGTGEAGGGAAGAGADWLAELRRRVGLVYNV